MSAASGNRKPAAERWSLPARQDRSRATRERLLGAAEAVFAEKGYDGARLQDIAARAGCSVGAVYFRFKDKNALFSAVAESFVDDARMGLASLLAGEVAAPEEVLRRYVQAAAMSFRRHRGLFRAIVERGIEHPGAMKPIFRLREDIAEALERALHRGGHGSTPLAVRVMTQMIYGFLIVGILNRRSPTQIDDARAVDGLADACVAYLLGSKAAP